MESSGVQTDQPTRAVITQPFLGDCPAHVTCPTCRADIVTRVIPVNGLMTWLFFGGLFLLGYFFIHNWILQFYYFSVI